MNRGIGLTGSTKIAGRRFYEGMEMTARMSTGSNREISGVNTGGVGTTGNVGISEETARTGSAVTRIMRGAGTGDLRISIGIARSIHDGRTAGGRRLLSEEQRRRMLRKARKERVGRGPSDLRPSRLPATEVKAQVRPPRKLVAGKSPRSSLPG